MKIRSITLFALFALALHAQAQEKKPLKIYLLAGQSNMTGMAETTTLEHIKMFPETAEQFKELFNADGTPVVLEDVYVSQWMGKESGKLAPILGGKKKSRTCFGPEYGFGIYMHQKTKEPFLIIKTSLGGSSLNYRYRSPSADKWTPPVGHPDLIKKEEVKPPKLPIPAKLELADTWTPEKPHTLRNRHMGLKGFKGAEIGKVGELSPIYVLTPPSGEIKDSPFQKGDLILGIDGSGLREDPLEQWRLAFYNSNTIDGDWMINVTRWRAGKIESFDFDITDTIEGGRAKLPEHIESMKQAQIEKEKQMGFCYRDMIAHVKMVLSDVKKHHPAYDPEAGYKIAGFAWFQGWNDMIDEGTYPNRDKPGGYDQYTWLLEHLIKDVRKDLNAPNMPTLIGVMGIGGAQAEGDIGRFQLAQAAVAEKPEFKGNVIAIETGKFWDHDLAAIVKKSNKTKEKMSQLRYDDGLEGAELNKAYAEYRAKQLTPDEEKILKIGVSDGDFHYLGSGKIMAGIGKGFAEAMIQFQEKQVKK